MQIQLPAAFFAYPSDPPSVAETNRTAIERLDKSGHVSAKSWEDCRVGGKLIINELCEEIGNAKIFCADLTAMNPNVMFELGYAIASNRRIWLALDPTFVDSKSHFEQLRILTTVGYGKYCNSGELVSAFFKDAPHSDLDNTVFEKAIKPSLTPGVGETFLYLKCRHETEASMRISRRIDQLRESGMNVIVDDPKESTVQSLTWYGVQVYSAGAIVCHLTGPGRVGATLLNARYALVCGMAFGMDKRLLMMSEGGLLAPIDYRDLLFSYTTAAQADQHADAWLNDFENSRYARPTSSRSFAATVQLATELKGLQVGEYIAENEADALVGTYFVDTTAYSQALNATHAIFVGRKGCGKSANFLKLTAELEKDKRNLVCVIKPVAYDLQGVMSLLSRYKEKDSKGYAIESLWKFLLYSEIANSAAAVFSKQAAGSLREEEAQLLQVISDEKGILSGDFTVRLQRCVASLTEAKADEGDPAQFRFAISEVLHRGVLKRLREVLGRILASKKRVAILIDNLDKAWDKSSDLRSLAEFLLGLLSASGRMPTEFTHQDSRRPSATMTLTIFLRSDIFDNVTSVAREPDKIIHSKIRWQDKELLLRVIDERFVSRHEGRVQAAELWVKYFCQSVRGQPTRSYLVSKILPRPRDLVFLVKAAVSTAVNRGQPMVRESDILEAEKQYSQYAFESVLVEDGIAAVPLENILYEFAGASARLTESEVEARLMKAGVSESNCSPIVNHLCSLSFLGLQVHPGDFRYAEDSGEHKRNLALAKQSLRPSGKLVFQIHPAFRTFLEVSST